MRSPSLTKTQPAVCSSGAPTISWGGAAGSLPNRRTASSRKCTSGGTSDGRHVVTQRAGHRPRLRTFGNRCPRVVSVLQSRTAAAFKTCRRTWFSARTTVNPASTIGHCRALAGLSVTFPPGATARSGVREIKSGLAVGIVRFIDHFELPSSPRCGPPTCPATNAWPPSLRGAEQLQTRWNEAP